MKIKTKAAYLRQENQKYTEVLEEIPREEWPAVIPDRLWKALRSNQFFVQIYQEADDIIRLTACRTAMEGDDWAANITWDSLQDLKRRCGYGERYAIEVYPREIDMVNVAAMRHLWILPEPLQIGWFRK